MAELYAFEQAEARVLQRLAREELLGPRNAVPLHPGMPGIKSGRGPASVRSTGTNARKSYLVETVDENGDPAAIAAATNNGGTIEPVGGWGKVRRLDTDPDGDPRTMVYDPNVAYDSDFRVVRVWNQTLKSVRGTKESPLRITQDAMGAGWVWQESEFIGRVTTKIEAESGGTPGTGQVIQQELTGLTSGTFTDVGVALDVKNAAVSVANVGDYITCVTDDEGNIWAQLLGGSSGSSVAIARTTTNIPAATIDATGVLTPGVGEVMIQYVDTADANKVKDEGTLVQAFNSALQPIVKDNGRVLKLMLDVNLQYWIEPPDYGPEVMVELYSPQILPAATESGGVLTPASAQAYLLTTKPGAGDDIERREDGGGADVQVLVWNSHEFEMRGTVVRPLHAVRDPDGHYWAVATETVVFFDTYLNPLPAASNSTTPGTTLCRTYTFNGTTFVDRNKNRAIYNVSETEVESNDSIRMAAVDGQGHAVYEPGGGSVCDGMKGLDVAGQSALPDIQYLIGIHSNGTCYKVPVADCPTQLEHA